MGWRGVAELERVGHWRYVNVCNHVILMGVYFGELDSFLNSLATQHSQ